MAGFSKNLKCWYQPANWIFKDGNDFVDRFVMGPNGSNHDDELKKMVAQIYDEQGDDLKTFEVMIILVHKE